nr:MAG TPA: cysteine-rich protein [Caudoviricetes sp.]
MESTRLRDFPLFCKNCRQVTIVNTEPEPKSQSR